MSEARRTTRDGRRRRLGQNFLRSADLAEAFVASAQLQPGETVIEIGAGRGALTAAIARRDVDVVAVELDAAWAARLRGRREQEGWSRVQVVERDILAMPPPTLPVRVVGCIPFGSTTSILHRLLDGSGWPMVRADLIVQWDVARKRAANPPTTLLSTAWAPWWDFELGPRISAQQFRPVPSIDAGVLIIRRRDPPLLPASMAAAYSKFLRQHWPFQPPQAEAASSKVDR